MIPGDQIVERIISSDPGLKDAVLSSRGRSGTSDVFTSVAWHATSRPNDRDAVMSQGIDSAKSMTTWCLLRETQSVLPKLRDRITIEGITWNVIKVTNIRWDGYGFDCLCVQDAS